MKDKNSVKKKKIDSRKLVTKLKEKDINIEKVEIIPKQLEIKPIKKEDTKIIEDKFDNKVNLNVNHINIENKHSAIQTYLNVSLN